MAIYIFISGHNEDDCDILFVGKKWMLIIAVIVISGKSYPAMLV
jgi:hypothetical protein